MINFAEEKQRFMKEKYGQWLMDVAKYITTGIVLSEFFGDMENKSIIYIVSGILVVSLLIISHVLQKGIRK
jgi:hypothetical protein